MPKEDDMTLADEERYEGFTAEQIERYKREVRERYDPAEWRNGSAR